MEPSTQKPTDNPESDLTQYFVRKILAYIKPKKPLIPPLTFPFTLHWLVRDDFYLISFRVEMSPVFYCFVLAAIKFAQCPALNEPPSS